MAADARPSTALDLRAVILVARLQPGPRLIFHYPPEAQGSSARKASHDDDSEGDSDSEVEANRREINSLSPSPILAKGNHSVRPDSFLSVESFKAKESGPRTLFGYSEETLQKLLSPGCWSDRKRFEICLDGLTFIGHPIWAASDGTWSRRHSHDDVVSKQEPTPPARPRSEPFRDEKQGNDDNGSTKPEASNPALDFSHAPESLESHAATASQSFATSVASENSHPSGAAAEKLSMFNVIFVIGPSTSDHQDQQVTDIYQHVARTLSKALHYCQRQDEYVGLQSKALLNAKVKAKQNGLSDTATCEKMVESSELAWCLKEVSDKVRLGEVAGIRLNGTQLAIQIPKHISSDSGENRELDPHSGLLLLESKDTLLRELTHPDASTLAHFIREHTPTKSLQKLSSKLGIALDESLDLARHLIKWRKARAIDPLHPRNTYIVCQDAPLDRIQRQYAEEYSKKFPVLRSLTQMLRLLGGKPVRYGMLIPSRDHRNPYMQILAWLVQYRIVEQLKTYGWLQAPTSIVTKTRRQDEINENRRPLSVTSLLSPQMRPVRDDDNISVSSERTAIPVSVLEPMHRRREFTPIPRPLPIPDEAEKEPPQIIKDPLNPSAQDEKRLRHITDTLDDEDLRDRFQSLLRYFDGTYAFEEIAVGEGVKRAKVDSWLDALQKDGFLVTFRPT